MATQQREREREGKESDRHGGQGGETYLTRGKKTEKGDQKGQLRTERIREYVQLILTLYFEISHTVLFVSSLVILHASDWLLGRTRGGLFMSWHCLY